MNLAFTRRDAQFRQLGEQPPYVGSSQLALSSTLRLEKFGLERLGISAPLHAAARPVVRGPLLPRAAPTCWPGPWPGCGGPHDLADRLQPRPPARRAAARCGGSAGWWTTSRSTPRGRAAPTTTQLGESRSSVLDLRTDYRASPAERGFRYVPGFFVRLVRSLPRVHLPAPSSRGASRRAVLRWTPAQIRFASSFNRTRRAAADLPGADRHRERHPGHHGRDHDAVAPERVRASSCGPSGR